MIKHDSSHSGAGHITSDGRVWVCATCTVALVEAIESYDFDDNDLQQAARQIISR